MIADTLKRRLVRLGPNHAMVRGALSCYACLKGYRLTYRDADFELRRRARRILLSRDQFVQIPWMIANFGFFFQTMESAVDGGFETLDFSVPGFHRYKNGVGFYFPSIPEDDVTDIYTRNYRVQKDDVIWDVGAHAGASTYFLSKLVGPGGRVYAFEPDDTNYEYLLKNIEHHGLRNVLPVKKAIGGSVGTAQFNMDGSMAAGIQEYLTYADESVAKSVELTTIAAACSELGMTPQYIKMDIEGAEVDAIRGSLEFIRSEKIHFAIESGHLVDGALTYIALERLFGSIGYRFKTEVESGQVFTWAAAT